MPFAMAEQPGRVLLSEVLTDPLGSDTGHEYIELVNDGDTAVDISGWDLDPDTLPYLTLPAGTVIAAKSTLTVYLRQQGTNTATQYFTGTQFGSTNMGNTKGYVVLFLPGGHDAAHLEDFVQWGEGNQSPSVMAAATGLFDGASYTAAAPEPQSMERFCAETSGCFRVAAASPGTSPLLATVLPESTGAVLPTGTGSTTTGTTLPAVAPKVTLQLLSVAMNAPTGMSDSIDLLVVDDGMNGEGNTVVDRELRVDTQHFSLADVPVHTGDVIHVTLGSGQQSSSAAVSIAWPQLSGLVATTEQVFLTSSTGTLLDALCWYRDPVPQSELADMQLAGTLWQGTCMDSTLFVTNAYLQRQDLAQISKQGWRLVLPPAVLPAANVNTNVAVAAEPEITTCEQDVSALHISEIMPNPDGDDSGQEWIELLNTSDRTQSLCNVFLDDAEGGSTPFSLTGRSIEPHGLLLLPDTVTKLVLGNTTDSARLLDADGNVLEEISYDHPPAGKSYSRIE